MDHRSILLIWIIDPCYLYGSMTNLTYMDYRSMLIIWIYDPYYAYGS